MPGLDGPQGVKEVQPSQGDPLLLHILLVESLLWNEIRTFLGITIRQSVLAVPVSITSSYRNHSSFWPRMTIAQEMCKLTYLTSEMWLAWILLLADCVF